MKIRWWANGKINSGIVERKIGSVFITRKNEHVPESDVITSDGRGGGREGSGRKKKEEKQLQVYSYVPPGVKEFLELEAQTQSTTVSALILEAILLWKKKQ